jgi:hypothetical protein
MSYAEATRVPIGRSQEEIKKILTKYGATGFAFGEQTGKAVVMFEMASRRVRFILPIPLKGTYRDKRGILLNQERLEQLKRSRWRSLALAIKAKLECVESGIATLEEEFLAHIVLPNGHTMGEVSIPQIAKSYENGKMPPLLGYEG